MSEATLKVRQFQRSIFGYMKDLEGLTLRDWWQEVENPVAWICMKTMIYSIDEKEDRIEGELGGGVKIAIPWDCCMLKVKKAFVRWKTVDYLDGNPYGI